MRSKIRATLAGVCCAAFAGGLVSPVAADPISYQGRIAESDAPADGSYDFNFQVFNAAIGGSPIGAAVQRTAVLSAEDNGLFAFDDLDFGDDVFTGEDRWIEVSVRQTGGGAFTTLAPRQAVRATPYALFAQNADVSLDEAYRAGNVISNEGQDPVVFRGLTQFGQASSANGFSQYFMIASASPILQFGSVPGLGGQTRWFDELGATIALFQADLEGSGLAMRLFGDGGVMEFDADQGPGIPGTRFFITGPTSGMSFNSGLAGDDSFQLPVDAIGQDEIAGEMGFASDAENVGVNLGVNFQPVLSRSITVPGPGHVVALANGSVAIGGFAQNVGIIVLGVSDVPDDIPDTQNNVLQVPFQGVNGFFNWPVSAHGVFEVPSAGMYTFYFNANANAGFNNPRMFDPNLTLLYIPTTYGEVTPTLLAPGGGYSLDAPVRGGLTDAEILAERVREQQRSIEAMRAAQDAMRAELDALRAVSEANQAAERSAERSAPQDPSPSDTSE